MAVLLYIIANMNYLMFVFDWDLLSHPLILLDVLNIFKGKRVGKLNIQYSIFVTINVLVAKYVRKSLRIMVVIEVGMVRGKVRELAALWRITNLS
jgi:hypothetical protein